MQKEPFKVVSEQSRFDRAIKRLPPDLRGAVRKVVEALQEPIPPPQFHYEHVKGNPVWRSVRLDNQSGYRVIFYEDAGFRVIAWIDAHDDAYEWARRNDPKFNDYGELIIVGLDGTPEGVPEPPVEVSNASETPDPARCPFAAYALEDLMRLGVPTREWAKYLQQMDSESLEGEIIRLSEQRILSEPTAERLIALHAGQDLRKLLPPAQLNLLMEECFRESIRRGILWQPEDWETLENYLQYPWQRWLVFLNPSQQEATKREFSGPARVTGGPGTGKTIVALHRAKHLAQKYPDQKVFLTTFTKSLVFELKRRMDLLNRPLPNLVIQHLDDFVQEQITRAYPSTRILYKDSEIRALTRFDTLCAGVPIRLTPAFIWDEWEQVVDAWNIRTEQEYLQFDRIGRGRALGPSERSALWKIFEQMRTYLRNAGVMTISQACYELVRRFRSKPPFRCVLADEAQDFGPAQMRLIQSLAPVNKPDNLFFCVDVSQRIYARSVPWVRHGIDIRGRSARLRINYRNTLEIQQSAEAVLPIRDQIEQATSLDDPEAVREALQSGWRPVPVLRNPDLPPQLQPCKSRADEAQKLKLWIQNCHEEGVHYNEIAIVARTKGAVDEVVSDVLRELGLSACEFEHKASEYQIYADTAHAIKGLEFRAVAIVAADLFPLGAVTIADTTGDALQRERNLLFTAMTRPRERLYISWVGNGTPFLRRLLNEG